MSEEKTYEGWAILELMGHRRLAGYVTEVELAGAAFLRIDVPGDPDAVVDPDDRNDATQFYSASAVYCLTPTTEQLAHEIARGARPRPVSYFDLPSRRALPQPREEDLDERERERAHADAAGEGIPF